jgi:hypothetical protein
MFRNRGPARRPEVPHGRARAGERLQCTRTGRYGRGVPRSRGSGTLQRGVDTERIAGAAGPDRTYAFASRPSRKNAPPIAAAANDAARTPIFAWRTRA